MSDLTQQSCEVCRQGAPVLHDNEIASLIGDVPGWAVEVREGINQLERVFTFRNFKQAMAFSNEIFQLAEEQGHHPSVLTEWGKVTVTWWSHSIKGLHNNDFICAAKTNTFYGD